MVVEYYIIYQMTDIGGTSYAWLTNICESSHTGMKYWKDITSKIDRHWRDVTCRIDRHWRVVTCRIDRHWPDVTCRIDGYWRDVTRRIDRDWQDVSYRIRINKVIIKVFISRLVLCNRTILSAHIHSRTPTGTRTQKYNDTFSKSNLAYKQGLTAEGDSSVKRKA